MLKKPKYFPVYVASYLKDGKIYDNSIIAKISKSKNPYWKFGDWGETDISSICIDNLNNNKLDNLDEHGVPSNTYGNDDTILIPKDIWIKYVKKANKLIDERNKKEGSSIKRISY